MTTRDSGLSRGPRSWLRLGLALMLVVAMVSVLGPAPARARQVAGSALAVPTADPAPASVPTGTVQGAVQGSRYHPVTPARLFDTREGTGGVPKAQVGPGGVISPVVVGVGGVPASGVTSVVLNVTAVGASATTFVTVWPSGETQPLASNLNVAPGWVIPNLVTVKVGSGGASACTTTPAGSTCSPTWWAGSARRATRAARCTTA